MNIMILSITSSRKTRLGILGEVIMYKEVRHASEAHITLSNADSIHI